MLSQPIPNHSLDSKPHDPGHDTTSHSTDHQLNQLPSTAFVVVFGSTDRVTVNGHRQYGTRSPRLTTQTHACTHARTRARTHTIESCTTTLAALVVIRRITSRYVSYPSFVRKGPSCLSSSDT